MKLIIGLGNPEPKYTGTRHNAGFACVTAIGEAYDASFVMKDKFRARIAQVQIAGEKVLLAQPTTYYNDSGVSYHLLTSFYDVAPEDTLVIHDELSLPFGTIRTRVGGSDAGNNGIKSINQHGGVDTARLRVGISNDQRSVVGDVDFVLGKLTKTEAELFETQVLKSVISMTEAFATGNHAPTSQRLATSED